MSQEPSSGPRLTDDGCRTRRLGLLAATDVDLIVITNPRHIFYYSGFRTEEPSLAAWGRSFLLIDASSGATTLMTHNWAAPAAQDAYVDRHLGWTWYDGATAPGLSIFPEASSQLHSEIDRRGPGRIGVEAGWFPALGAVHGGTGSGSSDRAELVDITPVIEYQRRVKQPDELELIRFALRVTETGFAAARAYAQAGASELELYATIQSAMTLAAGGPVQLIGDFLSGERTTESAGPATRRRIQSGDAVILDMGPIVNGYRGDFATTFVVGRSPDSRQQALEVALHEALAAGEKKLEPGGPACAVHEAVKGALARHGLGELFRHHAGHGLGLDHPEAPYFVPGSDEKILAGDVVTLEPGAYGERVAGRIEHVYLVTPSGPERLTAHSTSFELPARTRIKGSEQQ